MKPTLLVLAAGMGSRYGGVKQIDAVGLHGECLLDFATFDAKSAYAIASSKLLEARRLPP